MNLGYEPRKRSGPRDLGLRATTMPGAPSINSHKDPSPTLLAENRLE